MIKNHHFTIQSVQVRTHTASDKLSVNTKLEGLFFSYLEGLVYVQKYGSSLVQWERQQIMFDACYLFVDRQKSGQPMEHKQGLQ